MKNKAFVIIINLKGTLTYGLSNTFWYEDKRILVLIDILYKLLEANIFSPRIVKVYSSR